MLHSGQTPPPYCKGKINVFFSETRPLLGHFLKKSVFCPLEMSNTCKKFQNPNIGKKLVKYWIFFFPKWLRMAQNGFLTQLYKV